MNTIIVKKEELLAKIKANRENHLNIFNEAQEEYRKRAIKELESILLEVKDGKHIRRGIQFPEPINHTQDYDRVIAMLEMSVENEIKIESHEFEQFVLDKWGWSNTFSMTVGEYIIPKK